MGGVDVRIQKIQRLIDELDWPQARVARLAKITAPHLSNLLAGKVKNPHENTLDKLEERLAAALAERDAILRDEQRYRDSLAITQPSPAEAARLARPWVEYNVDPNQNPYIRGQGIAVSTMTSAGPDTDYQAGIFSDRYLPSTLIPYVTWRPVAFEVRGDSMEPGFNEGDVLIVAIGLEADVATDDYVVVGFNSGDEHTFKQLRIIDDETWELVPLNQVKHATRRIKKADVAWAYPVVGRWEPIFARRTRKWEK